MSTTNLETATPSSLPVSKAGAPKSANNAPTVPAPTSLTPRLRDGIREARTVPVRESALGHGLILEVKRLRALLVAHNIDPDQEA
jgi:hypothetical protein